MKIDSYLQTVDGKSEGGDQLTADIVKQWFKMESVRRGVRQTWPVPSDKICAEVAFTLSGSVPFLAEDWKQRKGTGWHRAARFIMSTARWAWFDAALETGGEDCDAGSPVDLKATSPVVGFVCSALDYFNIRVNYSTDQIPAETVSTVLKSAKKKADERNTEKTEGDIFDWRQPGILSFRAKVSRPPEVLLTTKKKKTPKTHPK